MRKQFYLSFFLFITLASSIDASAQDTVRVDNAQYSHYEKMLNRKAVFVMEEARELWRFRGMRIDAVVQKDQSKNVTASAIRFSSRYADPQVHLMPARTYGYLDADEVDSLLKSLELFANLYGERAYRGAGRTMVYNSRGSVYATCYTDHNTWRVGLTTNIDSAGTYTWFNIKRLREFIDVLKAYQGFQDPAAKKETVD